MSGGKSAFITLNCDECGKEFQNRRCWRPCRHKFCCRDCYSVYWHREVVPNMIHVNRRFARTAKGKASAKRRGLLLRGRKPTSAHRKANSLGVKLAIAEGRFNPVRNFGAWWEKPNKGEKRLDEILAKHFPGEFKLNIEEGLRIGGKIPDFVNINGHKVLVELFGAYWHGPEVTGHSEKTEERNRKACFSKWGFKTIIVWYKELRNEQKLVTKIERAMR